MGAFEHNKISEILDLLKDVRPIGIICIGYADGRPERLLKRIDLKTLVYYEKYSIA